MRIKAINNVIYTPKAKQNNKKNGVVPVLHSNTLTFKGKTRVGGSIGAVVGTLAGIGLTVVTGGIAAPILAAAAGCAAGAIGGDVIDRKIRPEDADEIEANRDFDRDVPTNYRDY